MPSPTPSSPTQPDPMQTNPMQAKPGQSNPVLSKAAAPTRKMPVWIKIFVGVLVLAAVGRLLNRNRHHVSPEPFQTSETTDRPAASEAPAYRQRVRTEDSATRLAQYQAQQLQVQSQMAQCKDQMDQAGQQAAAAAMQGQFYTGQPACQQSMPLWIAQEAVAETNIYRIKTGNYNATVLEVSGIQVGPEYSRSLLSSHGRTSSDDGTGAVDDWDRANVRETQIYRDENGQEQELADHNYYYRNRSSGQLVPSDSQNPPDNQHDWELLRPVSHND